MKTDSPDHKSSGHAPQPAHPAPSPLRLIVLLSVLAVVAGALLFDMVIAPPRVKASYEKLHETVLKHNELGLKSSITKAGEDGSSAAAGEVGGLLYSEDIQKILGMAPAKVEKTKFYTIEYYRWWGWIPRNRNYITVLYVGDPQKRHYSTHCANQLPEDELLPGKLMHDETPLDLTIPPNSAAASMSGGRPGGSGGGKEKGRPQGKGGKTESKSKGAQQGEKTVDESQADDVPKKSEEPAKSDTAKEEAVDDGAKSEPVKETSDKSK